MNKTLQLTKVLLKNGSGNPLSKRSNRNNRGSVKRILFAVLLAVAFIPVIAVISVFTSFLYDGFASIGQEASILGLGLGAVSLAIFIFGIFYVINVFYFSQDVEHLLPLPLKPSQILSAKFGVTLLYEYLTELFLLLPIVVTYGVKSGAGPLYYVYMAVIFLTLPVLPLVLASVIAMLVMRFTNVAKNKDRFRLIGGIVAIVIGLGANMFFQTIGRQGMTQDRMQEILLGGDNSMLDWATRIFPSTKLGVNALIYASTLQGLAALVMFAAISALVFVIFALLGEWLYFKGVMGASEATARRHKVTNEELEKHTLQSSALKALLIREMKTLFRTPPYFLNCVLITFLWPVIISIPLITGANNMPSIQELNQMLSSGNASSIALGIAFALFLFQSGSNAASSTAISREGAGAFVLKFLPVPYAKVIMAKALTGTLLSMIGVVLVLLLALFVIKLPLGLLLLMLAVSIPAVLFANLIGVLIDLHYPKLHWDTEQKAVKQNINVLISILITLTVAGAAIGAILLLQLNLIAAFLILFIGLGIVDVLLYRFMTANSQKWLNKLEV